MSRSYHDDAPAQPPRERHDLLDFSERLRPDVQLWPRVEGPRPCVVGVCLRGAEGDRGIELLELDGEARRHICRGEWGEVHVRVLQLYSAVLGSFLGWRRQVRGRYLGTQIVRMAVARSQKCLVVMVVAAGMIAYDSGTRRVDGGVCLDGCCSI